MDQRAAEAQLLLHAAGELADGSVPKRTEAGADEQVMDAPLALRLGVAEQSPEEVNVLEH